MMPALWPARWLGVGPRNRRPDRHLDGPWTAARQPRGAWLLRHACPPIPVRRAAGASPFATGALILFLGPGGRAAGRSRRSTLWGTSVATHQFLLRRWKSADAAKV